MESETVLPQEINDQLPDAEPDIGVVVKKAMGYLARREHSRHELRQKLGRAGFDSGLVEEVINQLQSQNLVSDRRFTEAYIRYRGSKGYGPQRIRMELGEKGVRDSLVEEKLVACEIDWYRQARAERTKKFGAELPADFKERARQARFLQYRGFNNDQIQQALDGTG